MSEVTYSKGVMVFGESGSVSYVGVVRDRTEDGLYELNPAILKISDRCYNLSDSLHELKSIKGEVTNEKFDLFADVRKQKIMSYFEVAEEETMLSLDKVFKAIIGKE